MAIVPKQAGHSVVSVRNSGRRGQRAGTPLGPEGLDVDGVDVDGVDGAGKPGVGDMAPIVAEPRRAWASLGDWGTRRPCGENPVAIG